MGIEDKEATEMLSKFNQDKTKDWNDLGLFDMLGRFAEGRDV